MRALPAKPDFKTLSLSERGDVCSVARYLKHATDPAKYLRAKILKSAIYHYVPEYRAALDQVTPSCIAVDERNADAIVAAKYGVEDMETVRDRQLAEMYARLGMERAAA